MAAKQYGQNQMALSLGLFIKNHQYQEKT